MKANIQSRKGDLILIRHERYPTAIDELGEAANTRDFFVFMHVWYDIRNAWGLVEVGYGEDPSRWSTMRGNDRADPTSPVIPIMPYQRKLLRGVCGNIYDTIRISDDVLAEFKTNYPEIKTDGTQAARIA